MNNFCWTLIFATVLAVAWAQTTGVADSTAPGGGGPPVAPEGSACLVSSVRNITLNVVTVLESVVTFANCAMDSFLGRIPVVGGILNHVVKSVSIWIFFVNTFAGFLKGIATGPCAGNLGVHGSGSVSVG